MVEDVKKWIKDHKKEILIACGVTVGVVITIRVVKNHEAIEKGLEKLLGSGAGGADRGATSVGNPIVRAAKAETTYSGSAEKAVDVVVSQTTSAAATNADTVDLRAEELEKMINKVESVGMHLRKLPAGYRASASKLAEANSLNIDLKDLYTIVDGYERSRLAA